MIVNWELAINAVLALVSIGCAVLFLLDRRHSLIEARLRELSPRHKTATSNSQPSDIKAVDRSAATGPEGGLARRLASQRGRELSRCQARLLQAGIYQHAAVSRFFTARLACMLGPPLVALLAAYVGLVGHRASLLLGSLCGTCGVLLPSLWLDRRIAGHHRALRRALPDLLDLMVVCLESGLSLPGTIQRVSDELRVARPALGVELALVQRDMQLGISVDGAFRHFAERTKAEVLRPLATLFLQSRRFGSELASALRAHAEQMRYHREQVAEELAQKASIKILFPTMLLILPAIFVVLAGPAAIKIQQAFSE